MTLFRGEDERIITVGRLLDLIVEYMDLVNTLLRVDRPQDLVSLGIERQLTKKRMELAEFIRTEADLPVYAEIWESLGHGGSGRRDDPTVNLDDMREQFGLPRVFDEESEA